MLSATFGTILLLLLGADVFGTVFHPSGRGGWLNRRLNRGVWELFRRLGPGSRLLAYAAPLMILGILLSWVVLVIAGFMFIYLPWIETFNVSPGTVGDRLVAAFYYSGYTSATLGFGDIVPSMPAFRILAPIQAVLGFALVSVSVTYLLSTYAALVPMRALATHLASIVRTNLEGENSLENEEAVGWLAEWGNDLAFALRDVLQSHFQYPVLNYFRPADLAHSLPVQLDRLLEWRDANGAREWETDPSLRLIDDAIEEFANELDRNFVPEGFANGGKGPDRDAEDTRRALDRLLRYMTYR